MGKIRIQRVKKVYVGGKREEKTLAGRLGFLGTPYEPLVWEGGSPDYVLAKTGFYRLHPDHPFHPLWRPYNDERFASLSLEAQRVYRNAIVKAIEAWMVKNPEVRPVHPDSADWNPEWESLKDDADKLVQSRAAFLMAHKIEFQAVPGLSEVLRDQLHNFTRTHYEVIAYDDEPGPAS